MGKPNIVLITADQWRGDCLGCAGGRHPVMTPHLNQIAAEGVRFANVINEFTDQVRALGPSLLAPKPEASGTAPQPTVTSGAE